MALRGDASIAKRPVDDIGQLASREIPLEIVEEDVEGACRI
jgi:hypothetical protein